jgi:ER membrane protein complex subunit 2
MATVQSLNDLLESANRFDCHNLNPREVKLLYEASKSYLFSSGSLKEDELYTLLEQHFYLAIVTGKDNEAKLTLQKIIDRFTEEPSKVAVLKSQYLEVTEGHAASQQYLSSRPANDFGAFKRKTVLLKQNDEFGKFVEELNRYLEICPTDSETWSELGEAYFHLKMYPQAVHAYQEVLVLVPLAYNAFARVGELLHVNATVATNVGEQLHGLKDSIKHFLRSVELCPSYVRGWAGTYVVTGKLLNWPKLDNDDKIQYEKILELSKKKLVQLVKDNKSSPADLEAAKKLLQT